MQEQANQYRNVTILSAILAFIVVVSHFKYNNLGNFLGFLWFLSVFILPWIPLAYGCLWHFRTKDLKQLKIILKDKHKAIKELSTECLYEQDINITYMSDLGVLKTIPNKHVYTETYVENIMVGKTLMPIIKTRVVTDYKFPVIVKTQTDKLYGFTDSGFMKNQKDFYILLNKEKSSALKDCDSQHVYTPFHDDYFRRGEECVQLFKG